MEFAFQKIVEKENFKHGEHNEKLYQDDDPKLFPNSHAFETLVIKIENTLDKVDLHGFLS
jgi:hypothetical protein